MKKLVTAISSEDHITPQAFIALKSLHLTADVECVWNRRTRKRANQVQSCFTDINQSNKQQQLLFMAQWRILCYCMLVILGEKYSTQS